MARHLSCRPISFENINSQHLDPSSAATALLWARRSGVRPDGDRASSPRRRPKCFRRENLHGIEAKHGASWTRQTMRRPAAPAILTIRPSQRSGRVSGPVLTATAAAQPEIRRRTFFAACALRTTRTKKRPVSVDCVASTDSLASAQGPGRCFGACRCRDWRICCRSRRGSVQFEILIRRPRANHTRFDLPGTDKRGKIHKRHRKKSKAGRVQNLNLLLGAGKNNRNSLSR